MKRLMKSAGKITRQNFRDTHFVFEFSCFSFIETKNVLCTTFNTLDSYII
jgi:hypothetical protein